MGYKSTYQELVYKQPASFVKRGEYTIQKFQKPLGRGSTGKVVRAKWIDGGIKKEVALKYVSLCPPDHLLHLHPQIRVLTRRIVDKETIKDKADMVALEVGMLKELDHPKIVSFLDMFESKHKYVHLCVL
jgi:serine/threonine protein kinase